jgi:ribonuclease E
MTDSSKSDHWGSLASDLGAKPAAESPPPRSAHPEPPPRAEQDARREPPPLPPVAEPDLVLDEAENETVEAPPIPDFLEAVRLERERSEALERAEWPLRLPDEGIDLAHDAGESFRKSREMPLEFSTDVSAAVEAESFESEGSEGGASTERTGRRRRRRRGRRGGRSGRDEAKRDDAKGEHAKSGAASDVSDDSHDDSDDFEDTEHATLYATDDDADSGGDAPRHRNIPTWPEAIGLIVDTNLAARSKSPSAVRGRSRGRGGKRRGRGGK